jgi:trimethylamine--corrinoid protein Co-methyltransferase
MNEVRPQISVLTGDQIERVHNFSLEILSTIGIRVDSTRAMHIFEKAGAKPAGDRIVRIPSELVQWGVTR